MLQVRVARIRLLVVKIECSFTRTCFEHELCLEPLCFLFHLALHLFLLSFRFFSGTLHFGNLCRMTLRCLKQVRCKTKQLKN